MPTVSWKLVYIVSNGCFCSVRNIIENEFLVVGFKDKALQSSVLLCYNAIIYICNRIKKESLWVLRFLSLFTFACGSVITYLPLSESLCLCISLNTPVIC